MKEILTKYLDTEIGINIHKAFHIDSAQLTGVHESYFTVQDLKDNNIHHFSYMSIVQIIENPEGVKVGGFFEHKKEYKVVIKVGHLVEYVPA